MQVVEGTKLSPKWKLEFRSDGTFPRFHHFRSNGRGAKSTPTRCANGPHPSRPAARSDAALPTGDLKKVGKTRSSRSRFRRSNPDFGRGRSRSGGGGRRRNRQRSALRRPGSRHLGNRGSYDGTSRGTTCGRGCAPVLDRGPRDTKQPVAKSRRHARLKLEDLHRKEIGRTGPTGTWRKRNASGTIRSPAPTVRKYEGREPGANRQPRMIRRSSRNGMIAGRPRRRRGTAGCEAGRPDVESDRRRQSQRRKPRSINAPDRSGLRAARRTDSPFPTSGLPGFATGGCARFSSADRRSIPFRLDRRIILGLPIGTRLRDLRIFRTVGAGDLIVPLAFLFRQVLSDLFGRFLFGGDLELEARA